MANETTDSVPEIDSVEAIDVVLDDLVTALGAQLMYEHNRNQVDNRKRIVIEGEGKYRMATVVDFDEAYGGEHTAKGTLKPRDFIEQDGSLKQEMELPVSDEEGHLGVATVEVRAQ